MNDQSRTSNPYQSSRAPNDTLADTRPLPDNELSIECRGNVTLTARLVRIASLVFGIGALVSVLQIIAAFRHYGFPRGWTWWHTLVVYRIVYSPSWLLLAWMLWKYAASLTNLADAGISGIEAAMEQQAKAWLALGLLMFLMLVGLAINMSGALVAGIPSRFATQ